MPAKSTSSVPSFTLFRSLSPFPTARATSQVPAFSISIFSGLAGQVQVAPPYDDGVTTNFPEYYNVGLRGALAEDPFARMEGGGL